MASGGQFLKSLAQARSVQWAKSWQWDSYFPGMPAPFQTWFPATEASRSISELETHSFTGFGDTFDIPFASGIRTFNTTFIDDHHGTIMQWLDDWMELYTLNRGYGTERLGNVVRPCQLSQSDGMGNEYRRWQLQVYPFGSLTYTGNSESRFQNYMVSFRIAGIDNPTGNPAGG